MSKKLRALVVTDVSAEEYAKRGGGNYLAKVERLVASGAVKPGELQRVEIRHDDWCRLLNSKGPCNCDPDVRVKS